MGARFCDKRNYVTTREIYGHQKINLDIEVKKNEKSWILKALYCKHLLDFLEFFFQSCTQIIVFLMDQSHTFFVLSVIPC